MDKIDTSIYRRFKNEMKKGKHIFVFNEKHELKDIYLLGDSIKEYPLDSNYTEDIERKLKEKETIGITATLLRIYQLEMEQFGKNQAVVQKYLEDKERSCEVKGIDKITIKDQYEKLDLVIDKTVYAKVMYIDEYSNEGEKVIDLSGMYNPLLKTIEFKFYGNSDKKIIGLEKFKGIVVNIFDERQDKDRLMVIDLGRKERLELSSLWVSGARHGSDSMCMQINLNVKTSDNGIVQGIQTRFNGEINTERLEMRLCDVDIFGKIDKIKIEKGASGIIKTGQNVLIANEEVYNNMLDIYAGKEKLKRPAWFKENNIFWRMKADEKKMGSKTYSILHSGDGNVEFRYIDQLNNGIYDLSKTHISYKR